MSQEKKFSRYRLWCKKPSIPCDVIDLQQLHNLPVLEQNDTSCIELQSKKIPTVLLPQVIKEERRYKVLEDLSQSQTNFLSLFGLVTRDTGDRLKKSSQGRKKRSCSSPHFLSLILQAEKQDLDGNLPNEAKTRKRKNLDVTKKKEKMNVPSSTMSDNIDTSLKVFTVQPSVEEKGIDDYHEEVCHICNNVGELLLCDTCPYVYHLQCAQLDDIPQGKWFCKNCEKNYSMDASITYPKEKEISKDYAELEDKRRACLEEAYFWRTEKCYWEKKIQETSAVLNNKNQLEQTYMTNIKQAKLLKTNIDIFLSEL